MIFAELVLKKMSHKTRIHISFFEISLHLLCNSLMKWAVPDLVLTAYVPHCEADILVLHSLHVKA